MIYKSFETVRNCTLNWIFKLLNIKATVSPKKKCNSELARFPQVIKLLSTPCFHYENI